MEGWATWATPTAPDPTPPSMFHVHKGKTAIKQEPFGFFAEIPKKSIPHIFVTKNEVLEDF